MLIVILQIILLGIALSMDAFAVSITSGLTITDLDKKKSAFIAGTFGVMQAVMPLIGYWVVELISTIVDASAGEKVGSLVSIVVSWLAFALLIFLGVKMFVEALRGYSKPAEEKEPKKFSIKEVIYLGIATSIDALGSGVALHSGLSDNATIWLHVVIILACTFIISTIGINLAKQVSKLLKGKYEICGIMGGIILVLLGLWIVIF